MPKRSDAPLTPSNQKKSVFTSQPDQSPSVAAEIKSLIRNTLLASPDFPRLYADVAIASAPNSNASRILARNYEKIVERVKANQTKINLKRTNMPKLYTTKDCDHIKVTGVRCGSPALRGEQFCYFHQRMLRTVKGPPQSRVHHAALLEDEESIQTSLMEVVNSLLRGTIEIRRAELILRALNTAVRNSRRAKFGIASNMVTELPEYRTPPPADEEADSLEADAQAAAAQAAAAAETARRIEDARQATRAEIARIRAEDATPTTTTPTIATTHVGTAASGCPSGPAVPGRSAVELATHTMPSARVSARIPDPTRRKAPQSVKTPAPKERKIKAHGASRG
jgi:hypothetical protein